MNLVGVGRTNTERNKEHNGIYIINLGKTWEKLQMTARFIVAIEIPQDIIVQSAKPYGQRAARDIIVAYFKALMSPSFFQREEVTLSKIYTRPPDLRLSFHKHVLSKTNEKGRSSRVFLEF